jgi:hypothetical protein
VAWYHGRRLTLRRHEGSNYRFAAKRPGAMLVLERAGTSAALVVSERSRQCGDVATTGELRRTAAP